MPSLRRLYIRTKSSSIINLVSNIDTHSAKKLQSWSALGVGLNIGVALPNEPLFHTPLRSAIKKGDLPLLNHIVELNCDVNMPSMLTPAIGANRGASNSTSNTDFGILFYCLDQARPNFINTLLKLGADPSLRDIHDRTFFSVIIDAFSVDVPNLVDIDLLFSSPWTAALSTHSAQSLFSDSAGQLQVWLPELLRTKPGFREWLVNHRPLGRSLAGLVDASNSTYFHSCNAVEEIGLLAYLGVDWRLKNAFGRNALQSLAYNFKQRLVTRLLFVMSDIDFVSYLTPVVFAMISSVDQVSVQPEICQIIAKLMRLFPVERRKEFIVPFVQIRARFCSLYQVWPQSLTSELAEFNKLCWEAIFDSTFDYTYWCSQVNWSSYTVRLPDEYINAPLLHTLLLTHNDTFLQSVLDYAAKHFAPSFPSEYKQWITQKDSQNRDISYLLADYLAHWSYIGIHFSNPSPIVDTLKSQLAACRVATCSYALGDRLLPPGASLWLQLPSPFFKKYHSLPCLQHYTHPLLGPIEWYHEFDRENQ